MNGRRFDVGSDPAHACVSRRPDTPENRSIVELRLDGDDVSGGTLLTVSHDRLGRGTTERHARFNWSVALQVIKELAEGRLREPIALMAPDA